VATSALVGAALVPILLAPPAEAACPDISVTSTADSGANTLRAAVTGICDGGVINIDTGKGSVISLSTAGDNAAGPSALAAAGKSFTINGKGAILDRSGAAPLRFFTVYSGAGLTLKDIVLQNGLAKGGDGGALGPGGGGGAGLGGAIFNSGTLPLNTSTLRPNAAVGGNGGTGGTQNFGGGGGGGMAGFGGSGEGGGNSGGGGGTQQPPTGIGGNATVSVSGLGGPLNGGNGGLGTPAGDGGFGGGGGGNLGQAGKGGFGGGGGGGYGDGGGAGGFGGGSGAANGGNASAAGFGGGKGSSSSGVDGGGGAGLGGAVFNNLGSLTITNSTISGNATSAGTGANPGQALGGGVFTLDGIVTMTSDTVAQNTGGGLYVKQSAGAVATLTNTIFAGNTADCTNDGGTVNAAASATNLIVTNSGCGTPSVTADPGLAALADNGGPTPTRAITNASSAFDTGSCAINTDQRTFSRPGTGSALCDIGAFELNGQPLTNADLSITKTAPPTATQGQTFAYGFTITNNGPGAAANVHFSDTLPAGTTFQSLVFTADTCVAPPVGQGGVVTCDKASLANAASMTGTIVVRVGLGFVGTLSNTGTVTATTTDPTIPNTSTANTTVGCPTTFTGPQSSLNLNSGGTVCVTNANVSGSISVSNGTKAIIVNSTIGGSIMATGAGGLTLCNSTVNNTVSASGTTGFVLIGDPTEACAGNTINGALTLNNNTGGVEVSNNPKIGSSAQINNNSGTGPAPDVPAQEIEANVIGGALSCNGNTPSVTNSGQPNTASAKGGQCAGL
jgi:uncharacterized repeat protein (TIGR01451 family)